MSRWWRVLVILIAVILIAVTLADCINEPHQPISYTAGSNLFAVTLSASDGCPNFGDTITLRATATNQTQQTQVAELRDRPVFDIIVGSPDTSQIRWSTGKALIPDLTRLQLEPGQSKTIDMLWKVDERPITVIARLIVNEQLVHSPIEPSVLIGATCGAF